MKKPEHGGKVPPDEPASPREMSKVDGFGDAMRKIVGTPKAEVDRRERAERARRQSAE